MAYDRRLIEVKGIEAETNFALSEYAHELSPEQLAAALQRGLMLPQELVVGSPCSLELLAAAAPGPTSSLGGGDGLGSPLPAWALQCDSHGSCGALPSASPAGSDLAGQLLSCILGSPLSVLPEPPRAVKAE